jgi:hypothetical protein
MVMPSGASDGSSRCTMALKEPLRSEMQIERTFKMAMIISSLSSSIKGLRQLRERFSDRARDSLRVDPMAPSRAHPRTHAAGPHSLHRLSSMTPNSVHSQVKS